MLWLVVLSTRITTYSMPPKVNVSRIQAREPEESPQRRSHYEILIQSNYRPSGPDDQVDVEERLYDAVAEAFTNDYPLMLNWYTRNGRMDLDKIDSVEAPIRVETGQKARGMRVHAHMRLDIRHHTRIQLDHDSLRRVLARHFLMHGLDDKIRFDPETGKGIYITFKLLKNPADAFEEYQKKKAARVTGPSARQLRAAAKQSGPTEPGARTPRRKRQRKND
jgi:hypothetical protein